MRVLLDENLPHDLILELGGHEVVTVQGLGWGGVKNGELLRRASGQVDSRLRQARPNLVKDEFVPITHVGPRSSRRSPIGQGGESSCWWVGMLLAAFLIGMNHMEYPLRIQFETNIQELVDATVRHWNRSEAGRLQRRRGIIRLAVICIVSGFVVVFVTSGAQVNALLGSTIIAGALGAMLWPFYGGLYDGGFRRCLNRVLTDQYGKEASWPCEIELRQQGVWGKNFGVEVLFDWKEVIAIDDVGDAVHGFENGGGGPSQDHVSSAPPFDVPSRVGQRAHR